MLRIIGAGLSRTGTHSLSAALELLGLRSIHFDTQRLNDVIEGSNQNPDFRRYDDVDAVCDLPAAIFYQELLAAYPESKVVLTVRDANDWYPSIRDHFRRHPVTNEMRLKFRLARKFGVDRGDFREADIDRFRRHLRHYVYGSTVPRELLFKKRYNNHNALVMTTTPKERLLVMDITAGDGWEKLCPFIGMDIPDKPFPHEDAPAFVANDHGVTVARKVAMF
ncbi:MAG: sulfotransferase family protein [Vitreimonas sp.]